ncbi:Uncharacterised protein [Staphylococcus condimenti]|nr:Uncharacterised protein [Staphylococcus condimenti]
MEWLGFLIPTLVLLIAVFFFILIIFLDRN